MELGFIGVGHMGKPMAERLLHAGHAVVVHDRRPEAATGLVERGARWAETPLAVAQACRLVLASLPGPREVEAVVLGEKGLLEGVQPGDIFVDLTTSSAALTRRLAALGAQRGLAVLDAPVSGGAFGAEAGTLAIMVGGSRLAFDQALPVLQVLGKNIFHVGNSGAGNVVKLVNNMMAFSNAVAAVEGLLVGIKMGMDPGVLWQIIKVSGGNSFILEHKLPRTLLKGDFAPTFNLEVALKDIDLATAMAREALVPVPFASLVRDCLVEAKSRGLDHLDWTAFAIPMEEATNVKVRFAEPRGGGP